MEKENRVNEITKIIVETTHPERVILFGSRAKDTNREDSDYDFLVIKKNVDNERTVSRSIYRALFEARINAPVDIIAVDFQKWESQKDSRNTIYHEILETGKILYGE